MKNKILFSLFIAGILSASTLSAQVIEEKKQPLKKDEVKIERKEIRDQKDLRDRNDFRKGDFSRKDVSQRADFKRPNQKGDFKQADRRKFDERRKFMAKQRMNKNSKLVKLHKDCKDCMKLDKKLAKHQSKKHPRKSGIGK